MNRTTKLVKRLIASSEDSCDVRAATLRDIDSLLRMQDSAFPDDVTNLTSEGIKKEVGNGNARLIVCVVLGEIAAYCYTRNDRFKPWTSGVSFVVSDKFKGQNIGGKLLLEAFRPLRWRPLLRLYVEKKNRAAVRLYQKLGCIALGERKQHYESGDDALIMYIFTWRHAWRMRAAFRAKPAPDANTPLP